LWPGYEKPASDKTVYQDMGYCTAMLKISISLDLEDGPPDPLDLLGDVVIFDGQSTMTLETTFVDVWLVALIDALPRLQSVEHVVVEAEEPVPLRVDVDSEGSLLISNGHGAVVARTISELQTAIREAAGELLNATRDIPNIETNPDLVVIRQFYRSRAN
jgi:hypothetical protein